MEIDSPPPTPRRPTKADWNGHRKLLTRLWHVENRKLSDVIAFMATHHEHIATERMYKSHFKKWNIEKKIKARDAFAILRKKQQRDAVGKETAFKLRGKSIDMDDVTRYLKRSTKMDESIEGLSGPSTPSYIVCRTPSPMLELISAYDSKMSGLDTGLMETDDAVSGEGSQDSMLVSQSSNAILQQTTHLAFQPSYLCIPRSPSPPQSLHILERLFSAIKSYCHGSFESKIWMAGDDGYCRSFTLAARNVASSLLNDFYSYISMAVDLLKKGSNVEFGPILSKGFSTIKSLLLAQHPNTLDRFLSAFVYLISNGRVEIVSMLCRYISQMAMKILPRDHPWCQICLAVGTLDTETFTESVIQSWICITDTWDACVGPFHRSTLITRLEFILLVHESRDLREGERMLRQLLEQLEQHRPKVSPMLATKVMVSIGYNVLAQGDYEEAERIGQEIILQAEQDEGSVVMTDKIQALGIVAWSEYYQWKNDSAERNLREALCLIEETWGLKDGLAIQYIGILENWLRGWGRREEADELKAEGEFRLELDKMDEELAAFTL